MQLVERGQAGAVLRGGGQLCGLALELAALLPQREAGEQRQRDQQSADVAAGEGGHHAASLSARA
ncbi:hypothetical protein BI344_08205 [Chromobacterium sphagni]|uniref:Uncharacterized protein n=1 Tax=Chromobacterium sphagni TaxID=1903179 RepID=A0ABX3CE72_9NEIS|nr:hypothetical protein BI344_08205 [Chromobacterium sphagni]